MELIQNEDYRLHNLPSGRLLYVRGSKPYTVKSCFYKPVIGAGLYLMDIIFKAFTTQLWKIGGFIFYLFIYLIWYRWSTDFLKESKQEIYFGKTNFSEEPIKLHFTSFFQMLIHTFLVAGSWASAESSQWLTYFSFPRIPLTLKNAYLVHH